MRPLKQLIFSEFSGRTLGASLQVDTLIEDMTQSFFVNRTLLRPAKMIVLSAV